MSDWIYKRGGRHGRLFSLLGLDSWIDSKAFELWQEAKERYTTANNLFLRLRLGGIKRLFNEVLSEALTLGTGGFAVLLALSIPAFQDINEGSWLTNAKYSVLFLDRNGTEIGKRGINSDATVPLEEIPDTLIKATLATEDRRFFDHYGIDPVGLVRAISTNLQSNAVVQGASTLTQQLAKNLFLSSERTLQRKIKEVFLAFWLETHLSKREILKLYLDRSYMGGGAFGVEAASQFYFGKSVRDVTLAESAMLAGLYKAPTNYAPHANLANARARANDVLSNLVDAGFMTEAQVHNARIFPATPVAAPPSDSPNWFLDWAFEEVQRLAEGKGEFSLVVQTTVDLAMQKQADQVIASTVRTMGRPVNARQAALVSMEPDGAVRAMVGGIDYGESQFNRASHAKRQPGSSFKVYVYATALEKGIVTSRSIVTDSSPPCGPRGWTPKNYAGGHGGGGGMPLGVALAKSLNTVAVKLSLQVKRENVVEMTQRLGIHGIRPSCSMALGDHGISPLEHVGGFTHFVNGGKSIRPYAVFEMRNAKGQVLYSHDTDEPEPKQVLSRKVVEQMNQMLRMVVTEGTAKKAELDFTYVIGKTGTSSNYKDAWFVGGTGGLITGVWFGNDDMRSMSGVTGGSLPATAWHSFMSVAVTDMNIPQLAGLPLHPRQVEEQGRLAELRKSMPVAALAPGSPRRSQSVLPDQMRELLRRLTVSLRRANGQTADNQTPAAAGNPAGGVGTMAPTAAPANVPAPKPARPPQPRNEETPAKAVGSRDRRADAVMMPADGDPAPKRTRSQP